MTTPIYFDYAASTPLDPRVVAAMHDALSHPLAAGNPSSLHSYGDWARLQVTTAAERVARWLNIDPGEVLWTSGATEANNLALRGAANFARRSRQRKHIITCVTEHKSVLEPLQLLEREGFEVTRLPVDGAGRCSLESLAAALRPDTALVSLMWVNNETGTEHHIGAIADRVAKAGALLHVDASQALGKRPVDLAAVPIDLLSASAHKFYGPKGAGFLVIRAPQWLRLDPLILGGGQQRDRRSGTLPVHQIVGVGVAAELAGANLLDDTAHAARLREALLSTLSSLSGWQQHGGGLPNIISVSFAGVNGEALRYALRDFALSAGSACTAFDSEPSHVLKAMRVPKVRAESALRISFGRFTTVSDVERLGAAIESSVARLRRIAGQGSAHVD